MLEGSKKVCQIFRNANCKGSFETQTHTDNLVPSQSFNPKDQAHYHTHFAVESSKLTTPHPSRS